MGPDGSGGVYSGEKEGRIAQLEGGVGGLKISWSVLGVGYKQHSPSAQP